MKLGYIVGYQEGTTPIDFGENRSKVKVTVTENTLKISEIFGFRIRTPKRFTAKSNETLDTRKERPPIDF